MRKRLGFLLAAAVFFLLSPFGQDLLLLPRWYPLVRLQSFLRLHEPGDLCVTYTPPWVTFPVGLATFLPLLGSALCVLALIYAPKGPRLPAVAPALAWVIAATVAVGAANAVLLLLSTKLPRLGRDDWSTLGDALGPCLWVAWCGLHLVPAFLLGLQPSRLARPAVAYALLMATFFAGAYRVQSEKQRRYAEQEELDARNPWHGFGVSNTDCY